MVRLDAPAGVRITDLSASGGALVVPGRPEGILPAHPLIFRTGRHGDFAARVVPVRCLEGNGVVHVGVRLEGIARSGLESLSQILVERFREDSRKVGRLLAGVGITLTSLRREVVRRIIQHYAVGLGRPVRVYSGEVRIPLRLRAMRIDVEAARQVVVLEVVRGHTDMVQTGEDLLFAFAGRSSVNHFTTAVWRTAPGIVVILMPPEIRQLGFRESQRVVPDRPVHVIVEHPRLEGERIERTLVDASARGLSFEMDPRRDALFPGERLDRIAVDLEGGRIEASGALRSVVPLAAGGLACGVEIASFRDAADAESWGRFVFEQEHPRLALGRGDLVESAWEALRSSGYLDLIDEREREGTEERFLEAWGRQARACDLGRFLVLERGGRPVGTAAASLLYPRTWIAHHFCIDRMARADRSGLFDLVGEIYSGIMGLLGHMAPLDFFAFFFDASKPLHDLLFGEFARRYRARRDMIYDRFTLYKRYIYPSTGYQGYFDEDIVVADPPVLGLLARRLAEDLTQLEVEAYCYGEGEIGLDGFTAACAGRGYERTRTILAALADGRPRAALVAETGEEGVNLFNLLNRCWIVGLDRGALDPDVERRLLVAAGRLYACKGKRSFLYVTPAGAPGLVPEALGFEFVADGIRWLAGRGVIPAYLGYLDQVIVSRRREPEDPGSSG